MDILTIGKMAKINRISEQTLRLYDKLHLLEPCEINPETGYRYYNIKQCAQLDMIQYMKSLGMNLTQIKVCFQDRNVSELRQILEQQKTHIEQQIEEMLHTKQAVERAIESFKRYDAAPDENVAIMEYQKERRIFCFDTKINCYSYGMEYYEYILRSLKENYALHKLPMSYFCNVGSIIRKEHFLGKELWSTEVFLFVEDNFESSEEIEIIPEGMYICIYCSGFDREEESLKKLMDFILTHDYQVIGDCISEILIEFPTFTHYERNAFFKLQVPVKRNRNIISK